MYEQNASASPLINCRWHAIATEDGTYNDPASEHWGLGFTRHQDGTYGAELIGPSLRARTLSGQAGEECWGVELKAHVILHGIDKRAVLGELAPLAVTGRTFVLADRSYAIPTYDTLEELVTELAKQGVLEGNERIRQALTGNGRGLSERTRQRQFRDTTGLTQKQIQQIERARHAFYLLQSGLSLAVAAQKAGFADQAHMTRSLKVLQGQPW